MVIALSWQWIESRTKIKDFKNSKKYTYSYKFPTKMDKGIFYNKRLKLF